MASGSGPSVPETEDALKSLRILDAIVSAAEVGYQPDYKTLATLRAQLVYDLAPYLSELEWPALVPAFSDLAEHDE